MTHKYFSRISFYTISSYFGLNSLSYADKHLISIFKISQLYGCFSTKSKNWYLAERLAFLAKMNPKFVTQLKGWIKPKSRRGNHQFIFGMQHVYLPSDFINSNLINSLGISFLNFQSKNTVSNFYFIFYSNFLEGNDLRESTKRIRVKL